MKVFYDEMTWPEVKEAAIQNRVALIPVGSIEDHGKHLPVMTDNLITTSMCNEVGKRFTEDVVVLPNAPYGFEAHHMDFPGSIDVYYATLIKLWVDIGKSLAHHGFKKIIFVNAHGSNACALDLAAREITISNDKGAVCCSTSWWNLIKEEVSTIRESEFPGGISHACELETSLVMYLRPDLVDHRYIIKEIPEKDSNFMWRDLHKPAPVAFMDWWSRYTSSGTIGDPTLANPEKGKKVFEFAVAKIGALVREFRYMEIKPRVNYQNNINE